MYSRNLLQSAKLISAVHSTKNATLSGWAGSFMINDNVKEVFEKDVEYTMSYELELTERTDIPTLFSNQVGLLLYSLPGENVDFRTTSTDLQEIGDKARIEHTFICPEIIDHRLLFYTRRYTTNGSAPFGYDTFNFVNLKLVRGTKDTPFSLAPEDIIGG